MAIPFTEYVNITSGLVNTAQIGERQLILRIFTDNVLVPTDSFAQFANSDAVKAYFGETSLEYKRAAFYFSFVSKLITQPQLISFASWVATARNSFLYGDPGTTANLATLQAITAGQITLTLGSITQTVAGLNFTSAGSFTAVATILQAAIRDAEGIADWTNATVTYNPTLPQGAAFVIEGGVAGASAIGVTPASGGTDTALGLLGPNVVLSQGAVPQNPAVTLANSIIASNNFASFEFMHADGTEFGEADITSAATWLSTQNIQFIFCVRAQASTAVAIAAIVNSVAGSVPTLSPLSTEFPELLPAAILAATPYDTANGFATQNYMYQQAYGLTPSVTNDTERATYDALKINYYGQTQDNGQLISFYQRGYVGGTANTPSDIGPFVNEIWFKAFVGTAWINLLLQASEIPTNSQGRSLCMSVLQTAALAAVANGVISVGNSFTTAQQSAITSLSGNATAWRQVQNQGYWFNVVFVSYVNPDNGLTEYKAQYTLIYAKKNDIRKVQGTHALV